MKNINSSFLLVLLLLSISATLLPAQKPVSDNGFEIHITQDHASHLVGNMRISESSGFPVAIYNPGYSLTPGTAEQMARQYLQANKSLLGLSDADLQNLQLHAQRELPAGTTVRLRQYYEGLPVNEGELTITISPSNKVCFVMNSFNYGVQLDNTTPSLSEQDARQMVLDYMPITGNIIEESSRLQILQHQNTSTLIYRLLIASDDPHGEWEAFVDAQNGNIIKLENIGCYYKDHHEAITPVLPYAPSIFLISGIGNVFNPDPLSTANVLYGAAGFTDNGDVASTQLNGELVSKTLLDISFNGTNYSLVGPWAEIQDFEAPLKGLFAQNSSTWNNNRNDDAFEAVNTYYHIDESMRYVNITLGLTIKPTAYTTGVRYDPHGLSGADNSHYLGGSQRVAFGEGGVDDAEDSDVIRHELGHGLHDWATNGNLSNVQGLSEGSGDYWTASYNRFLGLWAPADAQYNWVFNWDGHNPFWGGRIVNYTATYPAGLTGSIHTDGQIWATCMMKIWNEIGRINSDKAFWSGLAMTGGSSNQNDAANAVYTAATNMGYSYANLLDIYDQMTNTGYTLPNPPLPVELLSFTARKELENVLLEWRTASEINNAFYNIERSADGRIFESIGKVDAKNGNSSSLQQYTFTDEEALKGINYYRLKQTDTDGQFSFSKVINIRFDNKGFVQVYPNPASSVLSIHTDIFLEDNMPLSISDINGKAIGSGLVRMTSENNYELQISHLPTGLYTLKLNHNGVFVATRFFKQ